MQTPVNILESPVTMPVGAFLYECNLRHTGITDYGFSLEDMNNSAMNLPPEGARIDIAFEGTIEGPNLQGTIAGMDYGLLRADGRFQLNIHATITTDDGERIAFYADGIFRPSDGAVRENVQLTTSSRKYVWLNQLQIWARGSADLHKRSVTLKAYAA